MATISTVGHGTLADDAFTELVTGAGIEHVVDVRSFPGSRRNPQHGKDQMVRWLPAAGVRYSWMPALGGRRKPVEHSEHVVLRHKSFRAYADHMETDEFRGGVAELVALGSGVAVMCSESVWWRCHRRLLADHLVLVHGLEVVHLMHDGRLHPHHPTEGARLDDAGPVDRVVYDAGAEHGAQGSLFDAGPPEG